MADPKEIDVDEVTRQMPWPAAFTFSKPLAADDIREHVPPELQRWCILANEVAFLSTGYRNSCILTSHALAGFLRKRAREAWPVRTEAHTHFRCRCAAACPGGYCGGASLGSAGDGTQRPAAAPGSWRGHLAVACDGYLLDPTIDQAGTEEQHWAPLAFPLPPGWEKGQMLFLADGNGNRLNYVRYHRQVGWKSAPDARPSHWSPLVDLMAAME